jgi:hypothetical protein
MTATLSATARERATRLTPRQAEIVDEHMRDEDDGELDTMILADLFWDRAREARASGTASEAVLAPEFDAIAVTFEPDWLYPSGGRPACTECKTKPVYLGGLCGGCYAAAGKLGVA